MDAESESKKLLWPTSENEVDWQLDLGTSLLRLQISDECMTGFTRALHDLIEVHSYCQNSIWFSFVLHFELQSL